jgi:hypothetical protein
VRSRPWPPAVTNAFSNAAKEKEIQRRNLSKALPAGLEVARPLPGEARTARVRVWVDEDYRAGTLHWRQQIEEQLDEANQFLVPAVGIRLEAKAIEPWPARSADRKLGDVLTALEAQDPGDDVDWVIGYASALRLVEGTFEELGVARPLGRHLVVRGYADGAERKAFTQLFPDTSDAERERCTWRGAAKADRRAVARAGPHAGRAPRERSDVAPGRGVQPRDGDLVRAEPRDHAAVARDLAGAAGQLRRAHARRAPDHLLRGQPVGRLGRRRQGRVPRRAAGHGRRQRRRRGRPGRRGQRAAAGGAAAGPGRQARRGAGRARRSPPRTRRRPTCGWRSASCGWRATAPPTTPR